MLLEAMTMALVLTSTAFSPNGSIPKLYTCEGSDISPPLAWSGVAAGPKSRGLIHEDTESPDPPPPTQENPVQHRLTRRPGRATIIAAD